MKKIKYLLFMFIGMFFLNFLDVNAIEIFSKPTDSEPKYVVDDINIYDLFHTTFSDFDDSYLNYVICSYPNSDNANYVVCYAWADISSVYLEYSNYSSSSKYWFKISWDRLNTKFYTLGFYPSDLRLGGNTTSNHTTWTPSLEFKNQVNGAGYYYQFWTNFDLQLLYDNTIKLGKSFSSSSAPTSEAQQKNLDTIKGYMKNRNHNIDFSEKTIKYNETLFDNDPNFKKVCVNSSDVFSITSSTCKNTDANGYCVGNEEDFIWFKNGFYNLKTYFYDNMYENNKYVPTKTDIFRYFYTTSYWLSDKDFIDNVFNDSEALGIKLKKHGYTDKYSYFNYTLYPFLYYYNEFYIPGEEEKKEMGSQVILDEDGAFKRQYFQIFYFEEPYIKKKTDCTTSGSSTLYPGSSGNLHGGAGRPLEDENDIVSSECKEGYTYEYPNTICFYIKNNMEINILHRDGFGDDYGSVKTPWGDEDIGTTENLSNQSSSFFMNNVLIFLSDIKGTVLFINDKVFYCYNSLPFIVRLFILTCLTILFLKLVIDRILR